MKVIFKKTIHPVVKTTARKAIKTAGRYIAKTFTCEVLTSVATTGVSHCVSKYKDLIYENYSTILGE